MFFPPLSTQKLKSLSPFPSKHPTESCISAKKHNEWKFGLIKLISNKQAKWLTYRISWCNVRIKLGQSLWAWRAFTKCLPLLNRQRRDKSAWQERWSRDHWRRFSKVIQRLHCKLYFTGLRKFCNFYFSINILYLSMPGHLVR